MVNKNVAPKEDIGTLWRIKQSDVGPDDTSSTLVNQQTERIWIIDDFNVHFLSNNYFIYTSYRLFYENSHGDLWKFSSRRQKILTTTYPVFLCIFKFEKEIFQ